MKGDVSAEVPCMKHAQGIEANAAVKAPTIMNQHISFHSCNLTASVDALERKRGDIVEKKASPGPRRF